MLARSGHHESLQMATHRGGAGPPSWAARPLFSSLLNFFELNLVLTSFLVLVYFSFIRLWLFCLVFTCIFLRLCYFILFSNFILMFFILFFIYNIQCFSKYSLSLFIEQTVQQNSKHDNGPKPNDIQRSCLVFSTEESKHSIVFHGSYLQKKYSSTVPFW